MKWNSLKEHSTFTFGGLVYDIIKGSGLLKEQKN